MAGDADRNLLLGILAHQMDFVSRDGLFAAMNSWLLRKDRPLGEVLVDGGQLTAPRRAILEALVDEHVRAHRGDPARSLEAIRPAAGVIDDIAGIHDDDLRASVARARGETGRSLAKDPPDPAGAVVDPWVTHRLESAGAPSTVNGRFRIVRPHAQGGLGIVSVAIDDELDREVAFKEIQPAHADRETSRARFVLEAEFTGKLEHPGIIPIYGLGRDPAGRPFYAMRFIRGESLADAIDRFHDAGRGASADARRPLELRELLGRFLDVCDAVAYAHSRGVIHRDLKPANVMLGPYGETMVVDWGLALALERPPAESASAEGLVRPSKADSGSLPSERGAAIGTPLYMPPEQAEGAIDRLGPASDVYGLGAILYEVLTGRAPVAGDTLADVLERVRRGAITPPRLAQPQVPAALEAVCLKALALRPEDRYPSPRGLAADIKAWLADEPVSARRDPLVDRVRRWARRHRTAAAAVGAALLAGLVGLGGVALVQTRARTALAAVNGDLDRKNGELVATNDALDRERRRAEDRERLAIDAVKRFRDVVATEDRLKNDADLGELRRRLLGEPLSFFRRLRDDLAGDRAAAPDVLERLAAADAELAELSGDIGDTEEAIAARRDAVELRRQLVAGGRGAARADLASDLESLGSLRAATGRRDEAEADHRAALELRTALAAEEPGPESLRKLAGSHYDLGVLAAMTRRPDVGREEFQRGRDILQRLVDGGNDDPATLRALGFFDNALGNVLSDLGRVEESLAAYDGAVERRRHLVAATGAEVKDRLALAMTERNRGQLLMRLGRTDDAIASYGSARTTLAGLVAAAPTMKEYCDALANVDGQIGNTLLSLGRLEEARGAYESALAVRRRLAAANPTVIGFRAAVATGVAQLADVLTNTGQVDEAIGLLGASRDELAEAVAGDPAATMLLSALADADAQIARLLVRQGRAAEALPATERAIAIIERLCAEPPDLPDERSTLADLLNDRGAVLAALDRPAEGLGALEAALALRLRLVADNPGVVGFEVDLAGSYNNRAAALMALDRVAEAVEPLEAALAIQRRLADAHPDEPHYRAEVARSLQGIGVCAGMSDRIPESLAAYAEARAIQETLVAEQPDSGLLYRDLVDTLDGAAKVHEGAGRRAEARGLFEMAIERQRRLVALDGDGPRRREKLLDLLRSLGRVLGALGESATAVEEEIGRLESSR